MSEERRTVTQAVGIVTAYGAAVAGGFTGTYEQFKTQQASYAITAQAVARQNQESAASALVAEGYSVGTQSGTPVASGTYYQNNAKYYAELLASHLPILIDFGSVSAAKTVNSSKLTAQHRAISIELGTPASLSNPVVTFGSGTASINGTFSGSTTVKVVAVKIYETIS